MFALTITIILSVLIFDISLSMLNYRHRNQPIPKIVSDIYDQEEYKKWLNYNMEITRLSVFSKIVATLILLAFFSLGFFPFLARISNVLTSNKILQTLYFLGLYWLISNLISIPFVVYRTFVIEESFGFNTSTWKVFILDQIKSTLLAVSLGGPLLYLLLYLYQQMGRQSLLAIWLILMIVMLVSSILYTRVFIRFFNRLTPLEEGDLYDKTLLLAERTGYAIRGISIMDASKRSTKLNAFFTGFGKFKHIILFDTLLDKCSNDEIISILAHEIGHSKNRDAFKSLVFTAVQSIFFLSILFYFLESTTFAAAFGFSELHLGFSLIIFTILMEPIGILLGIPISAFSQKAEVRADAYAGNFSQPASMISALKVLARENYANLTPHPIVVKMTYSHPPVADRIAALKK